ncbi:reverse transcriptase-like protein [Lederbergia lenta]|uniref:RNase H n=2 Tax=Lederbergia lenta TaxID=1467 RepID=A0A2X4YXW9_LEDLE|nr:reverse transcriptase-like protein [Lederbergia lenta]SQI56675.1 RNase H [Lederbergia lenta]
MMKIKLKITYQGTKTIAVPFESEWIEEKYTDPLLVDLQKTGRIKDITIMDEMGREWNRKEYEKLKQKMESEPKNPVVYFDGGFDRDTSESGIGIVIYYEKGNATYRYRINAKLDELETNNEAEYAALYQSLSSLEEIGMKQLPCIFRGDSQGVLKQLAGEWPCYEKTLNKWLDRIEAKITKLGIKPSYEIISRTENKEADKLATQALENKIIQSHSKMV